jgi:hypothetical protein
LLNDDPDGQLVSGSIALGTASEAPTLHALPAGNTSTPFWYAAQYGLVEGFDYQMLSIQRSAIRLRFLLSAGQLWQSWCCDAGGTFDCPAQVAVASPAHGAPTARSCIDLSPTQSFDLRIEGDTMEGTIAPAAADFTPAVLRVRRMH